MLGMALIGTGIALATRAPVGGHFWSDLAAPMIVTGAGTAFSFIPISIAGLTGLGDGSGSLKKVNNMWEIDHAFSWVRDRHELKFGFDYSSRRFAFISPGAPSGAHGSAWAFPGFAVVW